VVFHVIIWPVAFFVTLFSLVIFRQGQLYRQVDYALLLTFVGFFVFVGNVARVPMVSQAVHSVVSGNEVLASVLFSQVLSNVPAAILLSGFTKNFAALLIGTNIGGLGTLIASMASLISYKIYAESEQAKKGRYIIVFTLWNVIGLALLLLFHLLFVRYFG
jgi:di/tricarboxylate transporter